MCSPLDGERAGSILSPGAAIRLSGLIGGYLGQQSGDLIAVHRLAQGPSDHPTAGGRCRAPGMDVAAAAREYLPGVDHNGSGGRVPDEADQLGPFLLAPATEARAQGWGHGPDSRGAAAGDPLSPVRVGGRHAIHSRHLGSPARAHRGVRLTRAEAN